MTDKSEKAEKTEKIELHSTKSMQRAWEGRKAASNARLTVMREVLVAMKAGGKPRPTLKKANKILHGMVGVGLALDTLGKLIIDVYGDPAQDEKKPRAKSKVAPKNALDAILARVVKLETMLGNIDGKLNEILALWK